MCRYCDFASGRRGMDRCSKCGGTGWQLHYYDGRYVLVFPDNERGRNDMHEAIEGINNLGD